MKSNNLQPICIDISEIMDETMGPANEVKTDIMHDYIRATFTYFVRDYHVNWGMPVEDILGDLNDVILTIKKNPEEEIANAVERYESFNDAISELDTEPPAQEDTEEDGYLSTEDLERPEEGAAEFSEPGALLYSWANTYYYGDDDELRDYEEAFKLFKQAADAGYTDAYLDIGECYLEGNGVCQDQAKAVKYWKAGAELGNWRCFHPLAMIYFEQKKGLSALECANNFIAGFIDHIDDLKDDPRGISLVISQILNENISASKEGLTLSGLQLLEDLKDQIMDAIYTAGSEYDEMYESGLCTDEMYELFESHLRRIREFVILDLSN